MLDYVILTGIYVTAGFMWDGYLSMQLIIAYFTRPIGRYWENVLEALGKICII